MSKTRPSKAERMMFRQIMDQRNFKHPLDLELYDIAMHLRKCGRCRRMFARILYSEDGGGDAEPMA